MRISAAVGALCATALVVGTVPAAGAPEPALVGAGARDPLPGVVVRYRVDGVSHLAKLGSDLVIGPGEMVAEIDLLTGRISGVLTLPPSSGRFLAFGFVPTTSDVVLAPVGEVTGTIVNGRITAHVDLDIGLTRTAVDGVDLRIGEGCRTRQPASIDLEGPFDLARIPLTGTYAIPAYGGCGADEPLDPLLTGLVSGPGNDLEMTLTSTV
ncbi:hypothetical protein [Umezawaea beigongshangensis]|uniref:hypothetical protein n=1 Tax=Umezawaea beigongshangensis TaxID=2780383 RepID=UPI0018F1F892|nr:hypothetical protein [Umezawaea beigongshangensis]